MGSIIRSVPQFTAGADGAAITADVLKTRVMGTPVEDSKSIGEVVMEFFQNSTEQYAAYVNFATREIRFALLGETNEWVFDAGVNTQLQFNLDNEIRGKGNVMPERVSEYEIVIGGIVLFGVGAMSVGGELDASSSSYGESLRNVFVPSPIRYNLASLINALERNRFSDDETPVERFRELIVTQREIEITQEHDSLADTVDTLKAGAVYLYGEGGTNVLRALYGANSFDESVLADKFDHGKVIVAVPEEEEVDPVDPVAFEG